MLYQDETRQKLLSVPLFLTYALLTIAVYTLPMLKFIVPYLIAGPLMLGSLLIFLFIKKEWLPFGVTLCLLSLLIAASQAAFSTTTIVNALNESVRIIRFFLPVFWAVYALKYTNKVHQMCFLCLFAALVFYIAYKTTIALEEFPTLARELARGKETSADLAQFRLENIGGFEFSYMMGPITFCATWLILKAKNYIVKLISFVATLVCLNFVFSTMYTTLLILTVCGICLLVFLNIKHPILKVLFALIVILVAFFLEDIFRVLSLLVSEDSGFAEKFTNIYNALATGNASEMGSRPEKLANAFASWLEHPLFGQVNPDANAHSLWASILCDSGLLGFGIQIYFFYMVYKHIMDALSAVNAATELFQTAFLYVLVLAFFNPIGYCFEITLVAFFVIPIFSQFFQNESEFPMKGAK